MVFVVNKNKESLSPCHPAKARQLLKKGDECFTNKILAKKKGGVLGFFSCD